MFVKRLIFAPILLVIMLVACSVDQLEPPAATTVPASQGAALGERSKTETPLPTTAPPASATPLPTTMSVAEPTENVEPATLSPLPSPPNDPEPLQVISGQTTDGAFFLGATDAPITVIDYSDFL